MRRAVDRPKVARRKSCVDPGEPIDDRAAPCRRGTARDGPARRRDAAIARARRAPSNTSDGVTRRARQRGSRRSHASRQIVAVGSAESPGRRLTGERGLPERPRPRVPRERLRDRQLAARRASAARSEGHEVADTRAHPLFVGVHLRKHRSTAIHRPERAALAGVIAHHRGAGGAAAPDPGRAGSKGNRVTRAHPTAVSMSHTSPGLPSPSGPALEHFDAADLLRRRLARDDDPGEGSRRPA